MGRNKLLKLATPSQRKKLKKRLKIIDYLNTDGPYLDLEEYEKLIN